MSEAPTTACGFVAILGAPNVGKSTLLNQLIGTKVSIVSPKVQTTRRRVLGITIKGETQLVFVDTPGIFDPQKRLDRAMVDAALRGGEDSDVVLVVIDAKRGLDKRSQLVFQRLEHSRQPKMLVLNKIDLVKPQALLPLIEQANARLAFERTFLVSAAKGDGCADILAALPELMPEGPWLFPEDQLSDLSERVLAAEITREHLFRQLHDELPYSLTVETEGYATAPDGQAVRIDQTIYVRRGSQKAIVLGEGGQQIKRVGEAARLELEEILGQKVHLFLFVKVREGWVDDPERYREMGLDYPGEA
ncbi:MAG: GTPase Era [Geminicoccaceae bacterium]|nr:MAG: GTPase Era [Geminicoccaceae bacterium]